MQGEWLRKPAGETSVVFVHGILSSGEQCWRNRNGMYWPELLQQEPELAALGIYVYTYQTGVFSGSYRISDIVDDLKERLFYVDKVINHHQIIFVCHSMGGIVVRKFIVERILEINRQNLSIGLFLVASPSLGSDYANYAKLISNLVGNVQAKALGFSQENNWLNDLDKEFKNIKESGGLNIQGKELIEDQPMIFKKLFKKQIVEPFSAARYFGEPYKVPGSDHSSIAKPENTEAIQHRLLVEFIKKIAPHNSTSPVYVADAFPVQKPCIAPNSKESPLKNASESTEETKEWQQSLIQCLAKQLQSDEIQAVVSEFINSLPAELAIPFSPPDWHNIAEYLVTNKDQGDNRYKRVLWFLDIANEHATNQNNPDALYKLFAYLLKTLVRTCDEDEKGLTKIPVNRKETVELINACKTTIPLVPGYDEANLEFENGQRNSRLANIGDFQPSSGSWDIETVCLEMAQKLLKDLGESDFNSADALNVLLGRLNRHQHRPEKSRLQGVYVHQEQLLRDHPLGSPGVAEAFREKTNNSLPLFVYGVGGSSETTEVLHTQEENIRGMVVEDNKVVENFNKTYGIPKAAGSPQQNPTQANDMTTGIHLSNIGSNATVNIVSGTQTSSQVGQGNMQISNEDSGQLLQLLEQLKNSAEQANDVNKQDYAVIDKTTKDIAAEVQKESGADKSVLAGAKVALSSFKDIASIAGSIEKITELLLPLIG